MTTPQAGQPWTDREIEAALDVYFEMLALDLKGRDFVKADYRTRLEDELPVRSKKSIELKWCNVSAVLDEMNLPWVDGYKPMPHYQAKLGPMVVEWLHRYPDDARVR